jgi:hypothetical protein
MNQSRNKILVNDNFVKTVAVLQYLQWRVDTGLEDQIIQFTLLPGHTHSDVDVAQALAKNKLLQSTAISKDDFIKVINSCSVAFQTRTIWIERDEVLDWKSALLGIYENLHYFDDKHLFVMQPHQQCIRARKTGEDSEDNPWYGLELWPFGKPPQSYFSVNDLTPIKFHPSRKKYQDIYDKQAKFIGVDDRMQEFMLLCLPEDIEEEEPQQKKQKTSKTKDTFHQTTYSLRGSVQK